MCVRVCARLGEIDVVGAIAKALNWWKVLLSMDVTRSVVSILLIVSRFVAAHQLLFLIKNVVKGDDSQAEAASYFNLFWDGVLITVTSQVKILARAY